MTCHNSAMGKTSGPYEAEYPVGTSVRITSKEALESFMQRWQLHHPLQSDQLGFADQLTKVKSVSFYHGADEIYELEDIPGIWHEDNLSPA